MTLRSTLLRFSGVCAITLSFLAGLPAGYAQTAAQTGTTAGPYTGFDMNLYPGDAMLPALHQSFSYVGYWLNAPPGDPNANGWKGKRAVVAQNGFGFLILFNGRLDAEFKKLNPAATGRSDAAKAIAAATAEGFPAHAIIFLDLEEGGSLMPNTAKYVGAWVSAIRRSKFRPGAYCSGIEVADDPGTTISTADDIRKQFGDVALWLANDVCPPAPGCELKPDGLRMSQSGRQDALVWQYAQSPRRPEFTRSCRTTYAQDGNCYAPGTPALGRYSLDLNLSSSSDPSGGR
ncbi:MAG TPA: glycoside hydrolase domain-containing protein [Acidobacteriaceae bacterium]|jgi:hypothetical protein|nr:glycoside hydrolase domain-containing protein [Acidobacteriaceae bacterium]